MTADPKIPSSRPVGPDRTTWAGVRPPRPSGDTPTRACVSQSDASIRSLVVDRFKRPNIEAPLIVWEYAMTLERWVVNAEERLMTTLVAFYNADYHKCARVCDEVLDPSGALLGRVREEARHA